MTCAEEQKKHALEVIAVIRSKVCSHTTTEEPHTCPYKSDVNNDNETLCRCCGSCAHECAMDV